MVHLASITVNPELKNGAVVVTGAGRGIGLEVVRGLADLGFRVLGTAPSEDFRGSIEGVKAPAGSGDVRFLLLDITHEASIESFLGESEGQLGPDSRFAVLVNNAGEGQVRKPSC